MNGLLEDHKGRLVRLKERCKDQLEKKIDDACLKKASTLLFKGVVWLARQQSEFIEHLKVTLGSNIEEDENKYRLSTAQPLSTMNNVGVPLTSFSQN